MTAALLAVLGGVVLLAVLGGIAWWMHHTAPSRRTGSTSAPPIVFIPADGMSPAASMLDAHAGGRGLGGHSFDGADAIGLQADAQRDALALAVSQEPRPGHGRERNGASLAWRQERGLALHGATPAPAPVPSVLTGTLRMLPGRLEVLAGLPTQAEIRFVQTGGGPQQRVTIGRQEGPPYEHVQLASQTVSRLHAALTYERGRWSVANLSETNPVRVNGEVLPAEAPARPLADGDVLELGEVVLRFRS